MKGKKSFTMSEKEQIEALILQECAAQNDQQRKPIRAKMRRIGFYRSEFDIQRITIELFHNLIKTGKITILGGSSVVALKPKKQMPKQITPSSNQKEGLDPWVGENPYVLILGTLPGELSLKTQAYYQDKSHNSFYKIMEKLFCRPDGMTDKDFITRNHLALWDCMKKAEREGSLDSNIRNAEPNEIEKFLITHPTISAIILNGIGETRQYFYQNFNTEELEKRFRIKSLPSTANTNAIKFEEKVEQWRYVKKIVDEQTKVHKD